MIKFRDNQKSDLKEFENQVNIFENSTQNIDDSKMKSIHINHQDLWDTSIIGSKLEKMNEQLWCTYSIFSSLSEDLKRFHKNLKIMESINSSEDDKYESQEFLNDFTSHENRLENYKQAKPQMEDQHDVIDDLIEEWKAIQIDNAKKIIEISSSIFTKTTDNFAVKIQKLESNSAKLVKNCGYLLKPSGLPKFHEKLKEEWARRYHFDILLEYKEKEMNRIIAKENTKRSNFIKEHENFFADNALSRIISNSSITCKLWLSLFCY